jgi:hypothetical protein
MAFAILLIGFLIGLYQAAVRGGDLQALAVTAIKYLVVAIIVAKWSTVFPDVNGSFNRIANFIGNRSGAGVIRVMTNIKRLQASPSIAAAQKMATCPGRKRTDTAREGDFIPSLIALANWSGK